MNVLFVHQNFPAQFRHVAASLAARPGDRVAAIGSDTAKPLPGVTLFRYGLAPIDVSGTHVFARRFDIESRRAEQVLYTANEILSAGFVPDIVVAHHGWGETLPLRAAFPKARLVVYCEYYYRPSGGDIGFDKSEPALSRDGEVALRARNAATLLALADCDLAVAATAWQRSTFPPEFQAKIHVCHEGVDTTRVAPDATASVSLGHDLVVRPGDELVTFVARDLEPIRGYREFMRALPRILRERPRARVLIVGGDGTSYGASPPDGDTWKAIGLREIEAELDLGRVHFLGHLAYADYLRVLQVSAVHVYLTHPFVLSWSLVESMAAGCAVVASDTGPCREIIDGRNGRLVDPFDAAAVAREVVGLLADPARARTLGAAARAMVRRGYEQRDCVAAMDRLLHGPGRGGGRTAPDAE